MSDLNDFLEDERQEAKESTKKLNKKNEKDKELEGNENKKNTSDYPDLENVTKIIDNAKPIEEKLNVLEKNINKDDDIKITPKIEKLRDLPNDIFDNREDTKNSLKEAHISIKKDIKEELKEELKKEPKEELKEELIKYPDREYRDYKDFYVKEIYDNPEFSEYYLKSVTANYNGISFELKKHEFATGYYDKDTEKVVHFSGLNSQIEYKEPPTIEELTKVFKETYNEELVSFKRFGESSLDDKKLAKIITDEAFKKEDVKENKKNLNDYIQKPKDEEKPIYFKNNRSTFSHKVQDFNNSWNYLMNHKNYWNSHSAKQADFFKAKIERHKDKKTLEKLYKTEYKNFSCRKLDMQIWKIAQKNDGVINRKAIEKYALSKFSIEDERKVFCGAVEMRFNVLRRTGMINDMSNSKFIEKNVETKDYKTGKIDIKKIHTRKNIKFEVNNKFYDKIQEYKKNEQTGFQIRREEFNSKYESDFHLNNKDKDFFEQAMKNEGVIDLRDYKLKLQLDNINLDEISKEMNINKGRLNKLDVMGYMEQLDENRYYITPLGQDTIKKAEKLESDFKLQRADANFLLVPLTKNNGSITINELKINCEKKGKDKISAEKIFKKDKLRFDELVKHGYLDYKDDKYTITAKATPEIEKLRKTALFINYDIKFFKEINENSLSVDDLLNKFNKIEEENGLNEEKISIQNKYNKKRLEVHLSSGQLSVDGNNKLTITNIGMKSWEDKTHELSDKNQRNPFANYSQKNKINEKNIIYTTAETEIKRKPQTYSSMNKDNTILPGQDTIKKVEKLEERFEFQRADANYLLLPFDKRDGNITVGELKNHYEKKSKDNVSAERIFKKDKLRFDELVKHGYLDYKDDTYTITKKAIPEIEAFRKTNTFINYDIKLFKEITKNSLSEEDLLNKFNKIEEEKGLNEEAVLKQSKYNGKRLDLQIKSGHLKINENNKLIITDKGMEIWEKTTLELNNKKQINPLSDYNEKIKEDEKNATYSAAETEIKSQVKTKSEIYKFGKDDKTIYDLSSKGIFNKSNIYEKLKDKCTVEEIDKKYNTYIKKLESHILTGTGTVELNKNGDYILNKTFMERGKKAYEKSIEKDRNLKNAIIPKEQEELLLSLSNYGNMSKEQIIKYIYNGNERLFEYDINYLKDVKNSNDVLINSKVVPVKRYGEMEVFQLSLKGEKKINNIYGFNKISREKKIVEGKLNLKEDDKKKEDEIGHDLVLYEGFQIIKKGLEEKGYKVNDILTDRQLRQSNGLKMKDYDNMSPSYAMNYILEKSENREYISKEQLKEQFRNDMKKNGYTDKFIEDKIESIKKGEIKEPFNSAFKNLEKNKYIDLNNDRYELTGKGKNLLSDIRSESIHVELSDINFEIENEETGEINRINVESAIGYKEDEIIYKVENIKDCIWVTNNQKQYDLILKHVKEERFIIMI